MDPHRLFRNQVAVGGFSHPFVDRFARFGATFDPGRGLGPCMLQPRSCDGTTQPVDLALTLHLEEDGHLFPVTATSVDHLPWCLTQHGVAGDLDLRTDHVYVDAGALACVVTLTNRGSETVAVRPNWTGNAPGDRWPPGERHLTRFGLDQPPLRRHVASWSTGEIRVGLHDDSGILPAPEARIRWADDLSVAVGRALPAHLIEPSAEGSVDRPGDEALHWRISAGEITLAPGAERRFTFIVNLRVHPAGQPGAAPWSPARPEDVDPVASIAAAKEDFLAAACWTGTVDGPRAQRAWRARWSLLRTGYRGDGVGELGTLTASTCVPNSGGFTRIFFWDSLFAAVALTRFNPDFARDAIRAVFVRQDPETGFCPEHVFDRPFPTRDAIGEAQAPVASWAVERHLVEHPDDLAFLAEMYPVLTTNHRHWEERGDRDGDGLAEWTWCGQTADDSPLYDEFAVGPARSHGWLPPVASVSLNAFLFKDARLLADFADRLGRPDEAARWRARAQAIQAALLRVCYVPEDRRFWDYNHATRRHRKVKTFYLFWPLWAGMDVPPEAREDLLDTLLDPAQFFGEIPFPSVAYDEPTYEAKGYWRGKAWPHISYWLTETLASHGRTEAAARARQRVLDAWLKDPYHAENMTSNADIADPSGAADYNWGAALVSLLLEEGAGRPGVHLATARA